MSNEPTPPLSSERPDRVREFYKVVEDNTDGIEAFKAIMEGFRTFLRAAPSPDLKPLIPVSNELTPERLRELGVAAECAFEFDDMIVAGHELCGLVNMARRSLSTPSQGVAVPWLPIESAPDDKTLLIYGEDEEGPWSATAARFPDGWKSAQHAGWSYPEPTHFTYLPAPPQPTQEKAV